MQAVWKFELHPYAPVTMPVGAKPLHVGVQADAICLWALVDPNAMLEKRNFVIVGTGHDLPEHAGKHLGTALLSGGSLVFHVFDIKEEFKSNEYPN